MAADLLITGIGTVSAFGPRRGLIDAPPPAPSSITRWPTPAPRRAFMVPRFRAGDIVPGLRARRMDPLTVWAIASVRLAVEDAGIDISAFDPSRLAVVAGFAFGCLERSEAFLASAARYGWGSADAITFPETLANAPASHVARVFGLRGPNITLSCRGISGESALLQARSILNAGEADVAIVIAGDMLTRPLFEWYESASVLSTACYDEEMTVPVPFSAEPGGLFPGEGMAALVLEPAKRRSGPCPGAYAKVLDGASAVEPDVSFGCWGRNPAPTVEIIHKLRGGEADVRLVVSGANGSAALDSLEANIIRNGLEENSGAIVSAPHSVCGEFEASGLLRLALAFSGQGGGWELSAILGPVAPGQPSTLTIPGGGAALLLGTAAGGGRAVVSLQLLPRLSSHGISRR